MTIKIDPEKIRDVIGKGGATIRGITEATGASIDIEDDGTIKIFAADKAAAQAAIDTVMAITADTSATFDAEVTTTIAMDDQCWRFTGM